VSGRDGHLISIEPERYELEAGPAYRFDPTRRDLFCLLGAGLLVLVVAGTPSADAQESGGGGRGGRGTPRDTSAWLHIGEDGIVTAYTGKTEVGQNIRTSLAQAVAEEIRVSVGAVRLVMADTDLTPYDAGTFGSRTTPSMAPQLRRAAAAAREMLIDLAAAAWTVDRATLAVDNGVVRRQEGGSPISYPKLLQGKTLSRAIEEDAPLTPTPKQRVLGVSVSKVDGREFVTGGHRYTSDLRRDGMLYGKVLRPPSFGAKLKSVDLAAAKAVPGATVVRDGDLVGVAAPTTWAAEQALAAIKAEWETPPQSSERDLFTLLRGGEMKMSAREAGADGERSQAEYTVAYIAHVPLEPRAAVAAWEGDRLTVWTGTQRPFGVREELAGAFGIPEARVRVIVPDTGSGYGGKHTGEAAIEAARLAKTTGKPVKLVWTREEEFAWAYFRPAGVIGVAATVGKDGIITAWECDNYNSGGSGLRSPYEVANRREEFHRTDSPLRQGSYRGLAATANHFARESHMDDLARAAGMDPLTFRMRNLKDDRVRAVLQAAADRFGWVGRRRAPGRGFGLAAGTEKGGYVANCVEVAIDAATGRVSVLRIVSAFECGAVVNPTHLQNQVEGATVMGLGGALFEAIHFDGGRITNGRLSRYRVPRFRDVPPIDVVLVDRRDLASAGAGETPIVAIAPALRNGILDATGVALRTLPLTPNGLKRA
jgi:nicotinate dehydrogenase subunit B